MSGRLVSQVYERELGHAEQAVLVAMADHANDDGHHCYPSVPYLAWKTGYKDRQVQRIMARLRDLGALVVVTEASRRRPTEYHIVLDALPAKPPFRGHDDSAGVSSEDQGCHLAPSGVSSSAAGVSFAPVRGVMVVTPEPEEEPKREELFTPFGREESREVAEQAPAADPKSLADAPAKAKPTRGEFTAKVKPQLIATLTAGVADLAIDSRTGKDRSWVGQCLGALGRWTHNDADAAVRWLDWWRRSEHWRFRGNDPAKWPAAMAAARDAYNDRPAAQRSHGPVNLDRRMGDGAPARRGTINLDRR